MSESKYYVDKIINKYSADKPIFELIIKYYLVIDKVDLTINLLTNHLSYNNNDADAFFARGLCYHKIGDFEKAEIDRGKAIELDASYLQRNFLVKK